MAVSQDHAQTAGSALDDGALLPCPFCGTETLTVSGAELQYVECKSCEADGPLGDTREEALAAWNRRPPITAVTSGHTPGPWEWDFGLVPPDGPQRYADVYKDGGDLIIAQFNDLIPEGRANARLIAAAPEMLSALKVARDALEEIAAHPGPNADDAAHWRADAACDALHALGPAIAKAEGK